MAQRGLPGSDGVVQAGSGGLGADIDLIQKPSEQAGRSVDICRRYAFDLFQASVLRRWPQVLLPNPSLHAQPK